MKTGLAAIAFFTVLVIGGSIIDPSVSFEGIKESIEIIKEFLEK